MDNRNMSLGGESIDWGDPAFSSTEFQDSMGSPFGTSAFNDLTNIGDYATDSPNFNFRTDSKSAPDASGARGTLQPGQAMGSAPPRTTESSSQDSSSDSSSRRKRKTTSESPMSDTLMMKNVAVKEEAPMEMDNYQNMQAFDQSFPQMPALSVDQAMSDNDAMFDFNSAASSPNLPRDFNQQLSLDAKINNLSANTRSAFVQESPVRAINPGVFMTGGSRDQSPATANMMFNATSPNAMFSTPSSDSNDFATGQNWNATASQNPAWPTDFASQFASPGGLAFTPSPAANGGTPSLASRGVATRGGRSPLHIAPISTKSRVETQINVVMTLERPPPGIEHLHLPLHTIAKSKLLAKEDYDKSKVLELHTMLVCSSAMHNAANKEKALNRAAAQDNVEIQKRAEQQRDAGLADEDKNDPKNVEDADKPANGGEVRICSNCIQRERKRAGRKKLKKEEEQQHWERYETERVVVFNSNEYLPFKAFDPTQQPQKDSGVNDEPFSPPEGAISVAAAMRIACYCRHQSEKEGFQVIFTLKDQQGNVVAQEMSDSILITDDHKTHPPQLATMASDVLFHPSQLSANGALPTSYSMMDLQSHSQPFTSSRSAGNLQALGYNQPQFNPHSHIHQLPNNGYGSHATSGTMTPTNLSRPGSPTSAGQAGPNKKRKSSTFHKRLPSGLQMTPRVDTSQPQSASAIPGVSMASSFSPTFGQQNDSNFMTVPQSASQAQFYGSGPPTPANEQGQFAFGHPHQLDITRAQNASAYFSHPSSAVPSRSNSPILPHSRLNMQAFQQRQPVQTTTNQLNRNSQLYGAQANTGAMQNDEPPAPTMTKLTPNSGPVSGGTEVSIFGYNFTHHTQIMFGDSIAPTTFYGSQCILATSPPGRRGQVAVRIVPDDGMQYVSSQSSNHIFTYTDTNPQMMEMALRLLSQQQTGDAGQWMQFTNQVANQFMHTSISPAGLQNQGYGGGSMLSAEVPALQMEDVVLKVLDLVDLSESPRKPWYDMRSERGETMLMLAAALNMHRVAAALLARGANPDLRDKGGYTALMHAALHGRPRTFQLLLVKGADPAIRSLKGYTAIDVVQLEERECFAQILQHTGRSRGGRPSFHTHTRYSYGSFASSKNSWDISSASFYDSEVDSSEHTVSMPASRRPSGNTPLPPLEDDEPIEPSASSAAMIAWRDALAAQIYHFQRTFHSNMRNFQLPALPPLPDYQDNVMVRRLSLLVPSRYATRAATPHVESETPDPPSNTTQSRFWDMFSSASPCASPPPPSYSELFPDQAQPPDGRDDKKSSIQTAAVDAMADVKCAMLYDQTSEEAATGCSGAIPEIVSPKKADRASYMQLSWLLMPLLIVMTSVFIHAAMPLVSMTVGQALDVFGQRSRVLLC